MGFSGVFVNLGGLYVFADVLDWPDIVSSAAAVEVSIIWNFLLNNAWTFKDKNQGAKLGFFRRMGWYNVVSLVGMGVQLVCFVGMKAFFLSDSFQGWVSWLPEAINDPEMWKYPAQLVGIAVAMAWNFLSNFYFTWAQEKSGPDAAEDDDAATPSAPERPA